MSKIETNDFFKLIKNKVKNDTFIKLINGSIF